MEREDAQEPDLGTGTIDLAPGAMRSRTESRAIHSTQTASLISTGRPGGFGALTKETQDLENQQRHFAGRQPVSSSTVTAGPRRNRRILRAAPRSSCPARTGAARSSEPAPAHRRAAA